MQASRRVIRFGSFELDVAARELRKAGLQIRVQDQPFALLELLVAHAGEVVTREEMRARLWPDGTFVDFERSLNTAVKKIRVALNDSAERPRYIETVPRHGYRFIALVAGEPAAPDALTPPLAPPRARHVTTPMLAVAAAAALAIAAYIVLARGKEGPPEAGFSGGPVQPLTAYPGFERHPSLSPDGSQVAFSWNGLNEDNYDIYVKLVGPGEPFRLTTDPASDQYPAWSPDGGSIAFLRFPPESRGEGQAGIYVLPALGGAGERKLADLNVPLFVLQGGANLSWSPNGKWLALGGRFHSDEPFSIWLISAAQRTWRRLTTPPGLSVGDSCPVFAPDGKRLAFVRTLSAGVSDVYVLGLTKDLLPDAEPVRVTLQNNPIASVAWMPDGRRLLVSSGFASGLLARLHGIEVNALTAAPKWRMRDLPFGDQATALSISTGGRLVYARHFSDSNLWRLNLWPLNVGAAVMDTTPVRLIASTFNDETPDYSPDGKKIAFGSAQTGATEIFIARADGSEPRQVTFLGRPHTSNPRWSPDGRVIVFDSRRAGLADLFVVSPETGSVEQLTDDPADELEPRWSRDGKWIYFGSNRTGRWEVYRIARTGGPFMQLTGSGGVAAAETPDGKWLYYAKDVNSPTSIWKVPVSGGEETKVLDGLSYSINFVLTESGIYYLAVGDTPLQASIRFFDFAKGKTRPVLELGKQWWYGMTISPDQRSLVYSVVDSAGSNLMLVDGVR